MDMDAVRKVAMGLTKFSMDNGIKIIDPNEELIGTNLIRVSVKRMGRTEEEIDKVIRQYKVLFLVYTPLHDVKILYKVVD